jgi:small multidrug resistance pump
MNQWLLLLMSILFEICGTTCMKLSQGFARVVPSVLIFVFYSLCFVAFTHAVKKIDLSVAYAVWSGLGIVLITIISAVYFREAVNMMRLICIMLILIGIIGLRLQQAP